MSLPIAVRTIILKSYSNNRIELIHNDGSTAIFPGMAVEEKTLGTCELWRAITASPDKELPLMIVTENNLFGQDVTDSYAKDSEVSIWFPKRGDVGFVLIDTTTATAITFGQPLTPLANGKWGSIQAESKGGGGNVRRQGTKPYCLSLEAIANTVAVKDSVQYAKVRFM